MVKKIKTYIPDTPEEWHLIGSYVRNLGSAMSGVLLFAASKEWVLVSLLLTWIGESVADYFGHRDAKNQSSG